MKSFREHRCFRTISITLIYICWLTVHNFLLPSCQYYHSTSTEAQPRKGIPEFRPMIKITAKPYYTKEHLLGPEENQEKTKQGNQRRKQNKQGKSLNKQRPSLKSAQSIYVSAACLWWSSFLSYVSKMCHFILKIRPTFEFLCKSTDAHSALHVKYVALFRLTFHTCPLFQ